MGKTSRLFWCAALLILTTSEMLGARTITVDFESDVPGTYTPNFVSVDSPLVIFSYTGSNSVLVFGPNGRELSSQGLGSQGQYVGAVLDFQVPVNSLSMLFGNDDPSADSSRFPEDRALLQAFLDGVEVGRSIVPFNFNDLADQTIAVSGVGPFDRAELTYVDSELRVRSNLGEVIDDVSFVLIPEPGGALLAIIASVAIACLRRRQRD